MSTPDDAIRKNEVAVDLPAINDAALIFIGKIRTPWTTLKKCPKQGALDGPVCRIEIFEPWRAALKDLETREHIEVFYWLHKSRRDLVHQSPLDDGETRGTFALRSPVRPNPIGTSIALVVGVNGSTVEVRGLDCLDGTPLIDLKPDLCPIVRPSNGDRSD